jgi:hypothetical protein
MRSDPPEVGEVLAYWFLWKQEDERGEESGRKLRPCVVVVSAVVRSGEKTLIALSPITHSRPDAERAAIEIPASVKSHLRLDGDRSWIICDELNEFVWPGFDLGKTPDGREAYGALPDGLMERVYREVRDAVHRGALKRTKRD